MRKQQSAEWTSLCDASCEIETANYDGLEPLYTEFPVGHFARSFTLPWQVDQQNITAHLEDLR